MIDAHQSPKSKLADGVLEALTKTGLLIIISLTCTRFFDTGLSLVPVIQLEDSLN